MGTAPALDEIYGIETLWRTTGNYLCNLEHYRKSLKYYDRAVEVCPNDIKTLLDRAKARAKVCQFEQALDDIKEALSIDKRDIISLAAKAHITYLNCEIEEALIQNYRLLPRRTKPNVFFLGILNCVSALEHSLGEICGRPLRDHFLIIRKQAWIKNYMSEKKVEFEPRNKPKKKRKTKHDKLSLLDKLREINNEKLEGMADLRIRDSLHSNLSEDHKIPPLETPFKFHPLQRYTKNVDLYMAEKYLDRMFLDKVFLKSIRKHQGVDCPNPTSATRIREIALDSYCNVCNKQEVLRSKRPFYYLKYVEAKVSGNLKLRQAAELQLHQQNMKKEADKIADKLRHFFNSHNLNGVISYVEKLKLYCDSKSKRILPNKEEYMQLIYEIIRKAFYNVNRINQEQLRWDQDKRIMLAVGQPISRDPSRDSVISFYRNFTMGLDLNDEIIKFKNRLVLAENDDEVCWYYHELGRRMTSIPLDEIYGKETLWRTTGKYLSNHEHYRKSLLYHNRAVAESPKEVKALLDRAHALTKVCQFDLALKDIDDALKIDKGDIISLEAKAHATYLQCEIEQALIQNYRLIPRRKMPDVFVLGAMNCISALEHSLGDICGRPLRDHFLVIRNEAWKKEFKAGQEVEFVPKNKSKVKKTKTKKDKLSLHDKLRKLGNDKKDGMADIQITDSLQSNKVVEQEVPPLEATFKFHPLQKKTTNVEVYMAEKYLDRMVRDKLFLHTIVNHRGIDTCNEISSKKIKEVAQHAYCNVSNKQEVLRNRRPFYYLKYVEARVSGKIKLRQDAELQLQQQNIKKEADVLANKLLKFFDNQDLNGVIDYVEKLKAYCDSKPKRLLPDKEDYMQLIYRVIRRAFYDVNRINQEQLRWNQDKRIMLALGQPISRDPSKDSVASFYNNFTLGLDLTDQVVLFENRLAVAANDEEVCWYYHELGRYNMLLGKYDEALNYANNCIYTARAYDQIEWVVNATVLLIRIHVRLKSKGEALVEAKNVLDMAKQLKDHKLQLYINRCIIVLNELEFDDFDGKKRIEKREAKILNLMNSDKLKEEFAHLFRTMKSMPHHRRISIVPHAGGRKSSEGGKEKSEFSLARKSKLGIEDPKDATEGARLLSLVQFHVD